MIPLMKNCRVDYKEINGTQYSVLVDYVDNCIIYFECGIKKLKPLYSEFKYLFNAGLEISTTKFFPVLKYLEFKQIPTGNYANY